MSCVVNYKEGKILRVNDKNGQESELFNNIAKLPFVEDLNTALDLYKGVLESEEVKPVIWVGTEPFTSYKSVIKYGKGLEARVLVGDTEIATFSTNKNPNTKLGLINNLISDGILKEERENIQGESFLISEGYSEQKGFANEEVIKQFARENGFRPIINRNGQVVIEDTTPESLGKIEDKIDSLITEFLNPPIGRTNLKSEESLKGAMLNLLQEIGFEVKSLERVENSRQLNLEGMVDFANKVVALKEGELDLATLSEEFSHVMLEVLPQDQLQPLLDNVHKTSEWEQYASQYRDIYRDENLLRKEILGKVLANSLQNRVGNETSQNIFTRLWNSINSFLDTIFNKEQTLFKERLENLTKDVQNYLLDKELSRDLDLDNLNTKKFRMYRVDQSKEAKNLWKAVTELDKQLNKGKRGSAELRALGDKLEDTSNKLALTQLLSLTNRQVDYIKSALDVADKNDTVLNVEEGIVLTNLRTTVSPILSKLLPSVKGDTKMVGEIERALLNIAKLSSDQTDKVVEKTYNRLTADLNNGETITIDGQELDARQYIKEKIDTAIEDTNFMFRNFGQLTHAKDPLLNILGKLIGDMTKKAHNNYYTEAKDFQKFLRDRGAKAKDLTKFYKSNGMLQSLWDFTAYEEVLMQGQAEIYHKYDPSKTVEEYKAYISDSKNPRPEVPQAYEEINRFARSLQEKAMQEDYYIEREEEMDKLGLSEVTKVRLRELSQERSNIMANVDTKNGYPSYSRTARNLLDDYNLRRRALKSPYNIDGTLKEGLVSIDALTFENAEVELEAGEVMAKPWIKSGSSYIVLLEGASEEAVLSYDVTKTDNALIERSKEEGTLTQNQKLSPEFWKILKEVESNEGKEAAKEYFLLNTNVGYSDEYWEGMDYGDRKERLDEYYLSEENQEFMLTYGNYNTLLGRRREILKQYQDSKDSTNYLTKAMSPDTKATLRSLTEDIEVLRNKLNKILPKTDEISGDFSRSERIPNQSYFGELADLGITDDVFARINFVRQNLTADGVTYVSNMERVIKDIFQEKQVDPNIQERLQEFIGGNEQESILRLYESRLPVYYMSSSPTGLRDLMNELNDGNTSKSVSELVQEIEDLGSVRLTNHVSFYESKLSDRKNPNFQEKFLGGRVQPKLSDKRFVSKEFVNMFDPKKDKQGNYMFDEEGLPIPGKNQKDFELYKGMLDFYKKGIEDLGELYEHNIYQAPQISASTLERVQTVISGKGVFNTAREWYKDIVSFRVDDMEQGAENEEGEALITSGQRTIPKLFVRRKEDMSDTSADLFYTINLFNQQAAVHKARKEASNEIIALEDKVLNRKYVNGKGGEATNTYKMAKSYIDYNIFGQKEIRNYRINVPVLGDVDLAKVGSVLHKYLRNNNLAYNLVIPATSWATAETSLFMESLTGQYIDRDSMSRAGSEFRKLMGGAIKETMALDSTSKLVVIGEHLDIFNYQSRIENSRYGTAMRFVSKLGYGAHTMGNFSPLSKTMLSSLIGHRIHGGDFLDFRAFKRAKKKEGVTNDKLIKAEWNALESKSFYSFMKVEDGAVKYDLERLKREGVSEERAKEIESSTIDKVKKIVEAVDGNIREEERTILQRDFLGRFLTTHKGWLAISLSRRLKSKHYSLQTETFEEGSYLTLIKTLRDTLGTLVESKKTWGEKAKAIRDLYVEGDEYQRMNIKRVLVDLGVVSALYLVITGLSAFADDDENRDIYAAQMSAYLFERLLNETKSSQIGIFGEIMSTVQDPVVGFKQTADRFKLWEALNTDIQATGQYAGVQKNYKYLMSIIPGMKSMYTISGAETLYRQRQSYNYFNSPDEMQPLALFLSSEDIKELYDSRFND